MLLLIKVRGQNYYQQKNDCGHDFDGARGDFVMAAGDETD